MFQPRISFQSPNFRDFYALSRISVNEQEAETVTDMLKFIES